MDLVGNRRRRIQKTVVTNALKDIYQHDVQLYNLPPTNVLQLQEFESLALERLQLLRILEQATQKGFKPFSNSWKESVYSELNKQNLKRFAWLAKSTGASNSSESDLQARQADHISHFILRLAYCRSDDLRRWFLSREVEWFKLRFLQLSPKSVEQFLALNNLMYTPIPSEEKTRIREELYQSTVGVYIIETTDFYKVPFTEVASLIKNRKVYLEKGFAYIPSSDLVTCITGILRSQLSQALAHTCRRLPSLDDERISMLMSNLHKVYTGQNYTQRIDGGSVSLAHIDTYSKQHYPLCMRHIHETFRSTHHMKHSCRLQYGLFTKAMGLSFEDAVSFWREEFTKIIAADKFDKQYLYGIKHQYGQAGKMTNYSAYNCMKIINSSVGTGEHHGCPFRHWDVNALNAKLIELGISTEGIDAIVQTATNGHYQIACSKYFEYTHGQPSKLGINHPNQYFEESMTLSKGNDGSKSQPANKQKPNPEVTMDIDDINWDETM